MTHHQTTSDSQWSVLWLKLPKSESWVMWHSMKVRRAWRNEGTQDRHTHKPISSIQQKTFMCKDGAGHCSCSPECTYCWLIICWISSPPAVRNTFKHSMHRHSSHHVEIWHLAGKYTQKTCLSAQLHPQYICLHYIPKYKHSCHTFSVTVYSGVCLACLNCAEGCLVAPFWLHLILNGPQTWVPRVHIARTNVTCVLEVGWWTDHGPVNPPNSLLHTFPLLCCWLIDTTREPLHPDLPRHVARLVARH